MNEYKRGHTNLYKVAALSKMSELGIMWPFDFDARVVFRSADFVKYFVILSVNFEPLCIGRIMSASTVNGDRKREIGQSPIKKKFSREDIDDAIANGIKLAFKEQQSTWIRLWLRQ